MRLHYWIFLAIAVLFVSGWTLRSIYYKVDKTEISISAENTMLISSPSFTEGAPIPDKFTCAGENISPELIFTGIPTATRSIVLVMSDPDAPGGTYTHWLVWDINPRPGGIPEGELPAEVAHGKNSSGATGYMGPCPPAGKPHRYYFRVFALDEPLADLASGATREELEKRMQNHILDQGELMGTYQR
ncbi:MAG: YbhB/YbcL family Raf kinase inhibitor-like protein [Candidatus Liptonbacteria bacterium]